MDELDTTELQKFLRKEKLSLAEKALAHYQAERLYYALEEAFFFSGPPYASFSSSNLLPVGCKLTRDDSKWGYSPFITISPPHLKEAGPSDEIAGTVIQSWGKKVKRSNGEEVMEYGGLYLY